MRTKDLMLIVLVLLTLSTLLLSQQTNTVSINGTVRDSDSNQPLQGVRVEAINEADTSQRASAVTDNTGRYSIDLSSLNAQSIELPGEFRLMQNYPNPFNPSTLIRFQIAQTAEVRLNIYNTLGQKIRTLINQQLSPGDYTAEWDATNDAGVGVAAGIYFYQLRTREFTQTRKMVLMDGGVGRQPGSAGHPKISSGTLAKANNLEITLRATSPGIAPFERRGVKVTSQSARMDIAAQIPSCYLNRNDIVVSEPSMKGKVYVSGLAGAVTIPSVPDSKTKIFVRVTNLRTQEKNSGQVNNASGFAPIMVKAAIGDQLKVSLIWGQSPVGAPQIFTVMDNIPPQVVWSKPTNGDKDIIIDAVIIVQFSEPVQTSSVNQSSFTLTDSLGTPVPGEITFENDNTMAILDPTNPLAYNSSYTITVTTDVADLQGLHLENTYTATFTTIQIYAQVQFVPHTIVGGELGANGAISVYAIDVDGDTDIDVLSACWHDDKIAWYENDGSQSFTAHTIIDSTDGANSVYALDVDGDGDVDVLSASTGSAPSWNGKIAWYENDGSQNFTAHTITDSADGAGSIYALSVYAIDVDGDTDIDVLSASGGDNKIAWYENDGSQNFTAHTITTSAYAAISVYAIDVDGDTDIDVLSASGGDNKIAWYENDGNQNFTAHTIIDSAGGASSVYALDVDGDTDIDVLSASAGSYPSYIGKIAWYENDGSQNFTAHTVTDSAVAARSVYALDVDGDTDIDVLSASAGGYSPPYNGKNDKIAWYENDGSQNFTAHTITTSANGACSVYALDVDGDTDIDVLSASEADDEIAWYENGGSQNFTAYTIATSANFARSVYALDVDGDTDIDVLSAGGGKIAWYENDGSQNFIAHTINDSAGWGMSVYALDVDGDGDVDVLSASAGQSGFPGINIIGKIAWYENDGNQNFTAHDIAIADGGSSVYALDVDGDTDIDVLSASVNTETMNGKLAWYENDGSQNFTAHDITSGANNNSVYALDVDGDSDIDVLSAIYFDDKIAWYENDGSQNFTAHTITDSADGPYSVYALDVDDDGDMDVLSASAGYRFHENGKIAWYENDGSQNFTAHTVTDSAAGARSVYALDVDGDTDIDVLSASAEDNKIAWYENDGSQNFTAHDITTSAVGAWSVYALDVDGDGDVDVLSASQDDDKIAWYENLTIVLSW